MEIQEVVLSWTKEEQVFRQEIARDLFYNIKLDTETNLATTQMEIFDNANQRVKP